MIDLHSHILPGVDDGAQTIEEAVEMARASVRAGTRAIFATPHVMKGSYYAAPAQIVNTLSELDRAVKRAGVDLLLFPGSEIYPEPTLPADYKAGRVTGLGNTRFLLIEAPAYELAPSFETLLFKIAVAGAFPVLAHPERNPSLNQDIDRLVVIAERGVLLQASVPSFFGNYGRRAQAAVEKMARLGIIAFLGTDAHDPRGTGGMKEARERIERLGGRDSI